MTTKAITVMDSEELNHLLSKVEELVKEVKQLNSDRQLRDKYVSPGEEENQFLTPEQLSKKLNKSISTIYLWRSKGLISAKKIGRSTFFDFNEVLQVLKS